MFKQSDLAYTVLASPALVFLIFALALMGDLDELVNILTNIPPEKRVEVFGVLLNPLVAKKITEEYIVKNKKSLQKHIINGVLSNGYLTKLYYDIDMEVRNKMPFNPLPAIMIWSSIASYIVDKSFS